MYLIKTTPFFLLLICFSVGKLLAQSTIVSGTVIDSATKRPLPSVTVYLPNTKIATQSNAKGKFKISSQTPFNQLRTSIVGYKQTIVEVIPNTVQEMTIIIKSSSTQLKEVIIGSERKEKYSNKNNPAVELIRKVIANKEKNRPLNYPFVAYREYDKLEFALANLQKKPFNSKLLRKYQFLLTNRDSVTVPGKSMLPLFLSEKLSQYYYRKEPQSEKNNTLAEKTVNFGNDIDSEGLGAYIKYICYKVDIYSNNIILLNSNFLSPIANSAPVFYKYFITDTITKGNNKIVVISFTPRNTTDVLFEGKLFITLDGNYAVQKADLSINKNINLNFINSLNVDLDFEPNPDSRLHLSRSKTYAEFSFNQKTRSVFGVRTIVYDHYLVNSKLNDSVLSKNDKIEPDSVKNHNNEYWTKNRPDTLNAAEANTYKNTDSLFKMRSFRRVLDAAAIIFGGYKNFGKFEICPTSSFISFNPVEGSRPQFGGRTTPEFSKRFYFETYAAYGSKDQRWKYFLSTTFSLNNKTIYKFPEEYIKLSYQNDITIPGETLALNGDNNVLFSFKHGNNLFYLYDKNYKIKYLHEYENHFSYSLGLNLLRQSPASSLYFINTPLNGNSQNINSLNTTEINAVLRYAPHEEFYQGKVYRSIVLNKHPIFSMNFAVGIKNIFNGQYNYQKLRVNYDQHFFLSQLGYADVGIEAGQIFGQIPYPLLNIAPANQTYFFDTYAYNLMNFMEFVSDQYASLKIDQHFNGFFLNKIPLFKALKWREVASFKALYGSLSDRNNPTIHPDLYKLPTNSIGQPLTYGIGTQPYIEASAGIENIFKIIRIDYVRRLTYLDHADIAKSGYRLSLLINF